MYFIKSKSKYFFLLFFNLYILIIFNFKLNALETLQLDDSESSYSAGGYFEYYEDRSNNLTIDDIVKIEYSTQFKKNTKDQLNSGYTKSAYWLKFRIKNGSNINNDYIIKVLYTYLSYIEFYYPDNNKYSVKKTGYFVPFNKRDEKDKDYIFHINLVHNEEKEFYLKITSDTYMNISINIYRGETFNKIEHKKAFLSGLYYGAMLIILLINIIILLFLRDRAYLYFIIFYFFVVMVQTILDNTSTNILFPDSSWFAANKITFLPCSGMFFSLYFIDNFFNLKKKLPLRTINTVLKILIIFVIIFSIVSKSKTAPINIFSVYGIFWNLFLFSIGIYFFINKYKPALYYLLGWSVFISSVFLYVLMGAGIIKPSFLLLSLYQIGSIFLMIFMPIAILDKYNILKKEKEDAEKTITEKDKDKFASIGMLLGGISHEIYNPLSGITGPLDNLKKSINTDKKPDKDKINKYIDYIEKNSTRIDNIIKNVRVLYKKEELEKDKLDINEIVLSVLDNYKNESNKNINFEYKIDKKIEVYGDKNAVYQVLNNLVSNAVDSINKVKKRGKILISLEESNNNKIIQIIDNGSGILNKDIDKIFNAFYSTKNIGSNIGLGLYIVKDLIIKLGWEIKVNSEEGRGTTFSITFKE